MAVWAVLAKPGHRARDPCAMVCRWTTHDRITPVKSLMYDRLKRETYEIIANICNELKEISGFFT
jgi:hypothetical protein